MSFSLINLHLKVYMDNIFPIIENLSSDTKWGIVNHITATLIDNESGLSGYQITKENIEPEEYISINGANYELKYEVTTNGIYYLWLKDAKGNIVNKSIEVNLIDQIDPNVVVDVITNLDTIIVDASESFDNESGISLYEFRIDDGKYYVSENPNYTFVSVSHGEHMVYVKITDSAGNVAEKSKSIFATVNTTLTVNPNGGSWNGFSAIQNYEKKIGTLDVIPEPTRTGYSFIGWDITGGSFLINYGTSLHTDESFQVGLNNMQVYNLMHNNTVTMERVASSSDNPIKDSNSMIKITTSGKAQPDLGGFLQPISSKLLGTFYHVVVAKVPKGYHLNIYGNAVGDNAKPFEWLTSNEGTGEFETYVYKLDCGTSGSFYNFGYLALSGPAATSENPITWYVAYSTILDAGAGIALQNDPLFESGINDILIYNLLENGNVVLNRVARSSDNPLLNTNYMIQISTIGNATPGLGGFVQYNWSKAKGVYYHVFYAKIPIGYTVNYNANVLGDGYRQYWLTSNKGTGNWEKYIYRTNAGATGSFNTFGHVSLAGEDDMHTSPVTWYVGYSSMFDATNLAGNYATYIYTYQQNSTITAKWAKN